MSTFDGFENPRVLACSASYGRSIYVISPLFSSQFEEYGAGIFRFQDGEYWCGQGSHKIRVEKVVFFIF